MLPKKGKMYDAQIAKEMVAHTKKFAMSGALSS